jgi:microcystin-dependent protein
MSGVSGSALGVPVGTVIACSGNIASGFLECAGAAISRALYAKLFDVIGITYGNGDGLTTFNLPDLRGEWIRGFDHGRGIDSGRALGSIQAQSIRGHSHTMVSAATSGTALIASGSEIASQIGEGETRPRNIAMYYAIKY